MCWTRSVKFKESQSEAQHISFQDTAIEELPQSGHKGLT